MKENATYVKESICSCGYPVLKKGIPLGKRYYVIDLGETGVLICGGCGNGTRVRLVMVLDEEHAGTMPLEIFVLDEEEKV